MRKTACLSRPAPSCPACATGSPPASAASAPPRGTSLNLGVGRGDDMDRVRENYRRFCAALGVDQHRAVLSKQVHEDNIRHVTAEDCGKGLFRDRDYTSVDAMVTGQPGDPPGGVLRRLRHHPASRPGARGRGRGPCRLAGRRLWHRVQNRPPDAGAVRHGPRGPAGRHRGRPSAPAALKRTTDVPQAHARPPWGRRRSRISTRRGA